MGDLSPHFSSSEFADKETGHEMPPPESLIELLERVRAVLGTPLEIVSGHRCCAHNAAVGGATQSRHIAGDAADIPPNRVTEDQAVEFGAVGVGVAGEWVVHVDVRPGPHVRWEY